MCKLSELIIGLCILTWLILSVGVCGSLDCNEITVLEAIKRVGIYTIIIACIAGITGTIEMWKESRRNHLC